MRYPKTKLMALILLSIVCGVYLYLKAPEMGDEPIVALHDYHITQHRSIEGIGEDLSGITYSRQTKTLFAVVDKPTSVIELSLKGDVLRIIPLHNFEDTEAIAHIKSHHFVILQERQRSVGFIEIQPTSKSINAATITSFILPPDEINVPKKGPEGVAWSDTQGLFVANEQRPSKITVIPKSLFEPSEQLQKKVDGVSAQQIENLPLKDISGLHIYQEKRRLLVLSDESRRIFELDFNGTIQSMFKLTTGFFDQQYTMEQPEGITMDEAGNIYVVGEPNIFLVLEKAK